MSPWPKSNHQRITWPPCNYHFVSELVLACKIVSTTIFLVVKSSVTLMRIPLNTSYKMLCKTNVLMSRAGKLEK